MSLGDVWSRFNQWGTLEINPGIRDCTINVGSSVTTTIDKLYGPACFYPIRVRADINGDQWAWVIEQQFIHTVNRLCVDENGMEYIDANEMEWREVARLPAAPGEDRTENAIPATTPPS